MADNFEKQEIVMELLVKSVLVVILKELNQLKP